MPQFDPVGFWIPTLIAIGLLPAIKNKFTIIAVFWLLLATAISYAARIDLPLGINLQPFYLAVVFGYPFYYMRKSVPPEDRVSVGPLLSVGFFLEAAIDFLATWHRYNANGTVGGAGWDDGLIRYFAFPVPVFLLALGWAVVADWVYFNEQGADFQWTESLKKHAWPKT